METQTIPTIKKVEFCPVGEMELYPKKILVPGDTISVIAEFERLYMTEPAQCEITPAQTANGVVYTTKIMGSVYEQQNKDVQHQLQVLFHSCKITDIYNNMYLVGTRDKPFPEVLFNPVNPASPAGKRVVNFEITWINTLPPIKIVDL